MISPSVRDPYKNRVLASFPLDEIARIAPHLLPLTFKSGQILHEAGQVVETIYFPEDAICSLVTPLKDGSMLEAGIIGRDGFVGTAALLGTGHSLLQSMIQLPGRGFSIPAKVLLDPSSPYPEKVRRSMNRSVHALLAQTAQTAACNRVHGLEERLARWLLMCHDRKQSDEVHITHEFLAVMLGTGRTTVTQTANLLRSVGLIEHSRGRLTIKDRQALEGAACECYTVVHREYVRLGLL
ncbi:MAG: Crp/Fnr family transcriptional regulator [Terracidiphilus sp.]|jgi:CRP-like cAMP-binding protein